MGLLATALPAVARDDEGPRGGLVLTAQERDWLARHDRIEIGVMQSWPPFGFVDSEGDFTGVSPDLIAALNRRLDGRLVAVPGRWRDLYDAVAGRRLAALMDITHLPDRRGDFDFTDPYLDIPHVLVARKGGEYFASAQDLAGRTLALEEGFGNVAYFTARHPEVRLALFPDTATALDAVARGRADAYAGNRAAVGFLLRQELFLDLEIQGRLERQRSVLSIGVRKDWTILRDILDKALDDLTLAERQQILDRWVDAATVELGGLDTLTPAERAWLNAHPVLRVTHDPNWAPVEYRDEDGAYVGMAPDYLEQIGRRLGVRFEPVELGSFEQAAAALLDGHVDLVAALTPTRQREDFALFTRPYIELPVRIFGREEQGYVAALDQLQGRRVAVTRGYAVFDWLSTDYPDLDLVAVDSVEAGLEQVADGRVDVFVGNLVTANYYLRRLGLDEIRVVGETPYGNRLAIGVRKDWPILASILQKGLDAIPERERNLIYNRWMSVRFEPRIDYALLWQVLGAVALVLFVLFNRNRRLAAEVVRREQAEAALRDEQRSLAQRIEQRTRELKASEERFRVTFSKAAVGIARVAPDGSWLEVNDKLCEILGYRREALLATSFQAITHPDDLDADLALVDELLSGQRDSYSLEKRYRRADGGTVWARLTVSLVRRADGSPEYFVSLVEDIDERKRTEEALERFFDQPMNLHLVAGVDGTIRRVNDCWYETLGWTRDELEGVDFMQLVHPDDRAATQAEIGRLAQGETIFYFENRYRRKDDGYRLLAWSASASGDRRVIFAVATDVTERRQAEERLREAAAVFGNTAEGVMITDADDNLVDVNDAFSAITGYSREEVLGKNPRILRSGRHSKSFFRAMHRSLAEHGSWRGELWSRRKDGSIYPALMTISTVRDADRQVTGHVGVFADISALKQTEQRLDHLAHHDPLTDLPNRLLFSARLRHSVDHAQRHGGRLALVFIDIDHFKTINDSLGHAAGDELLVQIAARLRDAVRVDDTVARISGDEFVVLFEGVASVEHATFAVEKLAHVMERPFALGAGEVQVTLSMGVSLYPQDGQDEATLLSNADAAMYRAKDEGRNNYQFYTPELTTAAFEHMFLDNALRGALRNDEFRLVYQPQYDLHSGRLVGVEALLRWDHPQQGTISPARFIPVAEQSGLIREIGRWVLEQACRQAAEWLGAGIPIGRVAVNVAVPQIQQADFVAVVERALDAAGLAPEALELEVTEGFVLRRNEASVARLEALRARGVGVAVDDFGTGYSSLSYLKQLPIDKLKIDQSFVRDIPGDANDMAIAEAIIAMGRALGLKVIAEGVETEAQAAFLRDKGCGLAQGFLYSQPLAADAIVRLLRAA